LNNAFEPLSYRVQSVGYKAALDIRLETSIYEAFRVAALRASWAIRSI
jgi:hypothetical protein